MSELQKGLEKLRLRLDQMGLRVQQAVTEAFRAVKEGNVEAGAQIDASDTTIDREEVAIEQECIRFLALYQPAAGDLRTIFTIVKINNDLERIADKASRIGRRVKHVVAENLRVKDYSGFEELTQVVLEMLDKTVRLLSTADVEAAREVILSDKRIDEHYGRFTRAVLDNEKLRAGAAETVMTLIMLGRGCERIGDLCANIAEDVIFWRTGDIVRHPGAFEGHAKE